MSSPWFISEADALRRDLEVARAFAADARRCVHPDMSDDTICSKLAARGYSADELRRMTGYLDRPHG